MPAKRKHDRQYTDFASVESQHHDLTAEEFPEGPYGADQVVQTLGKSTPWRDGQRSSGPMVYENRNLHEGLRRGYPGDHNTHDEHQDESPVE